jgi:GT2 family glycosyltransferase
MEGFHPNRADRPRVAVALPVHNQFPYLEESIASILAQTFREFELVIGCDGCSDGSRELLERFARSDERITLLERDRKSGLAASANWVVEATRAEFVAIAHGDDVCHPDRLARQLAFLEGAADAAAVGSVYVGIDPSGTSVQPPDMWRLARPSPFAPFAHSSVMFRRSAFDAVGGYRGECDYWEDLDLWWRLTEAGRIFVFTSPLVQYRHSASSSRGGEGAVELERSLELMYRAAERRWQPREATVANGGGDKEERRVARPRTFIARSWVALWRGERPRLLRAMLRRGRLRPDLATAQALLFLAWAALSPLTLRSAVTIYLRGRNRLARRRLRGVDVVEWQSVPPARKVRKRGSLGPARPGAAAATRAA